MIETIAGVGLAAFALGWLSGRRQSNPAPMRLVTRHAATAPGLVAKGGAELGQWQLYTTAFAFHANLVGFSYRALRDAGVCRRAAWQQYTDLLKGAGVIQGQERSATSWAGGWCYARLRVAIKHQVIDLPFPIGDPPALNSAKLAAQMAQRSTPATGGAAHA